MNLVKSSNINKIGYNSDEKQLLVEFKGGKTFSYKYVTSAEYDELRNADSVGSHFSKFIKNTKECQEVVTGDNGDKLIVNTNKKPRKNDVIAELKDRLESALAHILMIERIATFAPVDKEIAALTKAALEIDKAKSNV